MKIAYNNLDGDTITVEANTAKELVDLYPKSIKPEMQVQLSKDFNIHELALYLCVEMGLNVFEVIEKTEDTKPIMIKLPRPFKRKTKPVSLGSRVDHMPIVFDEGPDFTEIVDNNYQNDDDII